MELDERLIGKSVGDISYYFVESVITDDEIEEYSSVYEEVNKTYDFSYLNKDWLINQLNLMISDINNHPNDSIIDIDMDPIEDSLTLSFKVKKDPIKVLQELFIKEITEYQGFLKRQEREFQLSKIAKAKRYDMYKRLKEEFE